MSKTDLFGMSLEQMEEFMVHQGEQRYRGRQVYRWIYKRNTGSFYDMSDLPKDLRFKLDETAMISLPRVNKSRISRDGTRKFLLELSDKKRVETVAIPQRWEAGKKYTACLSTQVGCPLRCSFCATGQSGFERNLTAKEIAGQVIVLERELRKREKNQDDERMITNLVLMGMGEPLLNLDQILVAIGLINDARGINIGQRHITISTAGVVPGIQRLSQQALQVNLAISLHATTDEVRSQIIPLNRKYPIAQVMEAAQGFVEKTGRMLTLEYLLLDGVNSSYLDALRLAKMVKPLLAKVNLIPFNPVKGLAYKRPNLTTIEGFRRVLEDEGVNVTIREEMGLEIEAACGQLKNPRAMNK